MLSAAARTRISIVLVGARNPHNIGAAARAMHDFGFSDLRLVNDYAAPLDAAQLDATRAAVASESILRSARPFASLAEALADCTLAVGTTAIGDRTITHEMVTLADAAQKLLPLVELETERVALLFGSEKTGLTSEQLSHCAWLTTIPMFSPSAAGDQSARHLSMNLGQSVAVCLYELVRGGFEGAVGIAGSGGDASATGDDRERLTQLLLDVMHVTEYTRRFPANAQEPLVRQLTQHLGRSHSQAESWMGILRQVLWSHRQK